MFAPRRFRINSSHCPRMTRVTFCSELASRTIVAMLNKRKSLRRKIVLPVKVSVGTVTRLAHTVDITPTGARLVAYQTPLQSGMIIVLQRGAKKKEFRVGWIRQLSPNEVQAGVELLEPENNFWGVNLSKEIEARKGAQTVRCVLSGSATSEE